MAINYSLPSGYLKRQKKMKKHKKGPAVMHDPTNVVDVLSQRSTEVGEQFLAHFGVKGQRWGVRRSQSEIHGGGHTPSQDHQNATAAKDKARKGGVKTLSNKELQDMINRMNLEQQYARVAPTPKGIQILKAGGKVTGKILVNVGTQQATKLAADHATKLIGVMLNR